MFHISLLRPATIAKQSAIPSTLIQLVDILHMG